MSDEVDLDIPYIETLSVDELRRELRRAWDEQNALVKAIRDRADVPPYKVQLFLSRAAKWPEHNNIGKRLQQELGSGKIWFKSECEGGSGLWHLLMKGVLECDGAINEKTPASRS